jgi:transposase
MLKNGNWTDEQLQNAIAVVDNGLSIKKASTKYHILYSSFRKWCYGKPQSRECGIKGVLIADEESHLV